MKHQHVTAAVTSRLHEAGTAVNATTCAALPDNWSVPASVQVVTCHWPSLAPGGGRRREGGRGVIKHSHSSRPKLRRAKGEHSVHTVVACISLIYCTLQPCTVV